MANSKISVENLNLHYGENHALKNVNIDIDQNAVTAFIGPSGCGKSTLLKSLNRMNDLVEGCKISGDIRLNGIDIYHDMEITELRKNVGMVFQKPNPFPMSIYDNVAYGPRIHGIRKKSQLDEIVERSLRQAAIWDELKDRLNKSALGLSGGQQQRLCIARALLKKPKILVLDDSTSAVDTATDAKIREAFAKEIPGTTKLIIAQRVSSLMHADQIIVLDDGDVVGLGTHEELLKSCETYREIYNTQIEKKTEQQDGREA